MKNRFIKNLYQDISTGSAIAVLIVILLIGYFESLKFETPNNGWLLIACAVVVILIFFAMGFYWIFQMVEIDAKGIQVSFLGKQIRNVCWEQVEEIKPMTVLRNPAYVLLIRGEKNLNLDRRKKIRQAIEHYSDKCIN